MHICFKFITTYLYFKSCKRCMKVNKYSTNMNNTMNKMRKRLRREKQIVNCSLQGKWIRKNLENRIDKFQSMVRMLWSHNEKNQNSDLKRECLLSKTYLVCTNRSDINSSATNACTRRAHLSQQKTPAPE
jgi:hypothetical protein